MRFSKRLLNGSAVAWLALASLASAQDADPFAGRWALTIPSGGSGWLGIEQKDGQLHGSLLWGGGSVKPLYSTRVDGDSLIMTRLERVKQKPDGWLDVTNTIVATLSGDDMKLVLTKPNRDGEGDSRAECTGKRMPALGPKPNLTNVTFGEPVQLFNGTDLDGWRLVDPSHKNGWSAQDGVLVNLAEKGQHGYGNLRTVDEFEDFNLKLEVKVPEKSNSGIYLRGMYEVQVLDSFGKKPDSHNMGAIYSRIVPSQAAEKEHDVWQQMDITLLKQHVTVILNGVTIIENEPLAGCTGGALSSDPTRPGPILLQGNHGAVDYRNMVLRPVVNES